MRNISGKILQARGPSKLLLIHLTYCLSRVRLSACASACVSVVRVRTRPPLHSCAAQATASSRVKFAQSVEHGRTTCSVRNGSGTVHNERVAQDEKMQICSIGFACQKRGAKWVKM